MTPSVVVSGAFDNLRSGHLRFCEEVSAFGDLDVIVGHDANIRLLKGEGHPLLPHTERGDVVGSIRCVTQALVSRGEGWLDADPEIEHGFARTASARTATSCLMSSSAPTARSAPKSSRPAKRWPRGSPFTARPLTARGPGFPGPEGCQW